MKKVTYLLVILFSLVLVSTSCEKSDEVTPEEEVPTGIQPSDIVGSWEFVSLEFNGTTYTDCDPTLNRDYGLITMDLNITTTVINLTSACVDNGVPINNSFGYSITNNLIVNDHTFPIKYQIVNATTFDGTVLKLKLIDQGGNTTLPLNGTYTLEKL